MKVLVYGANGAQGGAAAKALMGNGYDIRVLMRSEEKGADWATKGAEVAIGNMGDLDSLKRAGEGCDAVFLIVPTVRESDQDGVAFGLNAVKAAKAAGITKIVWNTSGPVAAEGTEAANTDPAARVLRAMMAEGISFLGLQPTLYMENFLGPWTIERLKTNKIFSYPIPPTFKVQWVAARDFGIVAAAVFSNDLPNEIIQLGGPQVLDGSALAQEFSRALGLELDFETTPIDIFKDYLFQATGPRVADIVSGLYQAIQTVPEQLQPGFVLDADAIASRFNVQLTSLETWISEYRSLFE